MGGSQPNIPRAPNLGQSYAQGVNVYSQYLPQLLSMEQQARGALDPTRIASQQNLQQQYGPNQYSEMLTGLRELDPTFFNARQQYGQNVAGNLGGSANTPYQQEARGIEQQQYNALQANQPTQYDNQVNALRSRLAGDVNLGTSISPSERTQMQQYIRGAETAHGGGFGGAGATEEAYSLGDRGRQIYQQRIGNLEQNLGLGDVTAQNYQRLLGNASGSLSTLGDINTLDYQRRLGNVGSYLGMPTNATQAGAVPPVSPDRSFSYVNPNAGYLGAQYGLQNYQNQIAGSQLNSGGSNPWLSSLSGAASGASAGSVFGGYGTAIGAVAGGLYGGLNSAYGQNTGYNSYSDKRIKTDISKVGTGPKGVGIYNFAFKHNPGPRFRGVIAQDVEHKIPGAVSTDPTTGLKSVDYSKIGMPMTRVA